MPDFTVKEIDSKLERKILTGAIVSDEFCRALRDMYKPEFMKLKQSRIVFQWCFEFFLKYGKCIGREIESRLDDVSDSLRPDDFTYIKTFLESISDEYDEKHFNVPHLVDRTKKYFSKRSYEVFFERGKTLLERDKLDAVRRLVEKQKEVRRKTSDWFYPFSSDEILKFNVDDTENKLMRFEGALGHLIGWIKRGWLVSLVGLEKGKKTFWITEFAFLALTHGLKVYAVNLEMNKAQWQSRIYQRLTGLPSPEVVNDEFNKKEFICFPVFDCVKNQDGTCKKVLRRGRVPLLNSAGDIPEYHPRMKYKVCSACRGTKDFKTAYWFDSFKPNKVQKTSEIERKARSFENLFGKKNFIVETFPAYSANSDDINQRLDELEYVEGFVPDVLLIDYLEITDDEKSTSSFSERGRVDAKWKKYKKLGSERHMAVITVEQAKAAAVDKKSLGFSDWSEDKRKNAHVDLKIGLNQHGYEADHGVMRIGMILNRHGKVIKSREVMVLQQLDIGQICLDSEFMPIYEGR